MHDVDIPSNSAVAVKVEAGSHTLPHLLHYKQQQYN